MKYLPFSAQEADLIDFFPHKCWKSKSQFLIIKSNSLSIQRQYPFGFGYSTCRADKDIAAIAVCAIIIWNSMCPVLSTDT